MNIWIIEDYKPAAETLIDELSDYMPDARVKYFEKLRDTNQEVRGPDIAFLDITAVCPISEAKIFGQHIWPFAEKYPGTSIVVISTFAGYTVDSVEKEFRKHGLENQILYMGREDISFDLGEVGEKITGVTRET